MTFGEKILEKSSLNSGTVAELLKNISANITLVTDKVKISNEKDVYILQK